jgi:predicted homoserine dehydrogenase-like protein
MNFHAYYAGRDRPVETCAVGTGGFGQSFVAQNLRAPLVRCRIAVDVDAEAAARGLRAAGADPRRIRVCGTAAEAKGAWAAGDFIAAGDVATVLELPFEVLIEATGRPEPGARHATLAIEAGKHVVLVSKEVDSVVGPGLFRVAAERGTVVGPVDGDQPSLLIGLCSWAEVLGFGVIAAGKSSEYDFVFDPAVEQVTCNGTAFDAPGLARHLSLGDRDVRELLEQRTEILAALPTRAVPDLCELGIAANALGLDPDRPDFHAPIARQAEVPEIFATGTGILSGERRIDVFNCLRLPDEPSFAGGVFVVLACDHAASWAMLAEKGHVVARGGATAMIYLPRHLLGLEAATSVLDAAMHGRSGYGTDHRPRLDLVAVAERDLPAGTVLGMGGHHHTIDALRAELRPAAALTPDAAAPFYLAADRVLARPVAGGEAIRMADLEIAPESRLHALRRMQDRLFFGGTR